MVDGLFDKIEKNNKNTASKIACAKRTMSIHPLS